MTLRIVILNMRKLRRLPKRRHIPIQVSQPLMNMRISTSNVPDIRLEMLDINRIKPHNRRKQSDICFRHFVPVVIGPRGGGKMGLDAVERGEELRYGFCVCFFCGGEAGSVNTVVDIGVSPLVRGFDFCSQILWVKVDVFVFFGEEVVELVLVRTSPSSKITRKWKRKGTSV